MTKTSPSNTDDEGQKAVAVTTAVDFLLKPEPIDPRDCDHVIQVAVNKWVAICPVCRTQVTCQGFGVRLTAPDQDRTGVHQ